MRRGERILLLAVVVALVAAVGTAAGAGGQDTGSGNETVLTLEPTGETSADELSAAATAVERRLAVAGEDDAEATASDGVVTVRVDGSAVAAVSGWVSDPGAVSVVAAYPSGGDAKTATLLGPDDFGEVGEVQSQDDRWFVPIRLTDDGSETFRTRLAENGFTDEAGIDDCRYEESPEDPGHCLLTGIDGRPVEAAGMSSSLAETIENGEFDGTFVMSVDDRSTAGRLTAYLHSGRLSTNLTVTDSEPAPAAESDGSATDDGTADTDSSAANDTDDGDESGGIGPGFAPVVTVVALLLVGVRLRSD